MSYSIQCVHCKAVLKSPTPVPGGKTVKCPKCKQAFTTPAAKSETPQKAPDTDEAKIPEIDDDLVEPDEVPVETSVEEGEPPSKKKKKRDRDDEDDEDDDKPHSRKRRSDPDEDDEEDDREKKSKKKKKKKAGSPLMMILLLVGGGFALLACCGCGIGGGAYFGVVPGVGSIGAPDITGKWSGEVDAGFIKLKHTWEFRRDGTGTHDSLLNVHFRYRQSGNKTTITYTGVGDLKGEGTKVDGRNTVTFTTRREGDTLTLIDDARNQSLTLRKAP